jgi:hypothetical protein
MIQRKPRRIRLRVVAQNSQNYDNTTFPEWQRCELPFK